MQHRKENIPTLLNYFLEKKSIELKMMTLLGPEAVADCMEYHWPGNVREMENVVERALILAQSGAKSRPVRFAHLTSDPIEFKKGVSGLTPHKIPSL